MSDETQQKAVFVDEKTQKELNTPLQHAGTTENKDFLEMLIKMIADGKINLYRPDSLINHGVYDKLDEAAKGKADLEATNMLAAVREIKGLHDAGYNETYQMDNTVEQLRISKERLEDIGGDLFII